MGNTATFEKKPATLKLFYPRARIRSVTRQPAKSQGATEDPSGLSQFQLNGYPAMYPIPGLFPFPPPSQWPNTAPNVPLQMSSSATPVTDVTNIPRPSNEVLNIVNWFQQLTDNSARNPDSLPFAEYGLILKEMGFHSITQLSRNFLDIKDLQEWLKIKPGTAIAILDYAQRDIAKFKASGGIIE